MKKILFTAAILSTLFGCTKNETRNDSELLAMAEYRMEVPMALSQVGFENILKSNVNFQYVSENTNALTILENLPRDRAYTMMAPMDYAFAKAENPLDFELEDYIIEGKWSLRDLNEVLETEKSLMVQTLSGVQLEITSLESKLYISNGIKNIEITFTDLETESNTLHVLSELW